METAFNILQYCGVGLVAVGMGLITYNLVAKPRLVVPDKVIENLTNINNTIDDVYTQSDILKDNLTQADFFTARLNKMGAELRTVLKNYLTDIENIRPLFVKAKEDINTMIENGIFENDYFLIGISTIILGFSLYHLGTILIQKHVGIYKR